MINIFLEPVKVGIKGIKTKNKTLRKYSNNKIQFIFFYLPYGQYVNSFFLISPRLSHIGRAVLKLFFSKVDFAAWDVTQWEQRSFHPLISLSP